ncbi:MAG: dihydropteroate synthase [Planctomycetes bacterium]|nr:dihydropteroate synthase [Planctomycetota bacterium]
MRLLSPHGRSLELGRGTTRIMGVLNVTPDSFSDGGRFLSPEQALRHATAMVSAGADLIDVGAESTRPGHRPVEPEEQLARLVPVLEVLRRAVPVPISVDTTRAAVAERALRLGADLVNDTSGLDGDPDLAPLVARWRAPVVLMHRFTPARTGAAGETRGPDLVEELAGRLQGIVARARAAGIAREAIVLDPGIGFGTLPEDNLTILRHLGRLRALGYPLLVGTSRKSFLGALTGRPPAERAFATAATVAMLARDGVEIVRVHDVAEMRDVVRVADAVRGTEAGA